MKSFVPALALATAVAAEADPQLLVQTSPLLKTIVPQQAVKLIKPVAATTYTTAYQTPVAHAATPLVYNAPAVVAQQPIVYTQPQQVQYIKPVAVEQKEEEQKEEQTVQVQAYNTVYQPSVAYAHPTIYNHAAIPAVLPAQRVYDAKNGEVRHTVINKREAEPVDYLVQQTGPTSSIKYPTLEKTLRAYNKVPVATIPYANTAYAGVPYQYATQYAAQYQVPYVAGVQTPYVAAAQTPVVAAQTPYQYVF